ncbi:hypothetical protein D7W79_00665 [Corallococcus exercitus]|nr:hypothetical protein D7W79_00665 [Corallococcus exercitus]
MGLSTASFAGAKSSQPIYVDNVNRAFSGSMGSVRNSSDTTQSLYCSSSSAGYGSCIATNASGVSVSCLTTNANLLAVIRSVNSDSYVQVTYDSTGNCTSILVGTGSNHEPKQP